MRVLLHPVGFHCESIDYHARNLIDEALRNQERIERTDRFASSQKLATADTAKEVAKLVRFAMRDTQSELEERRVV